jgi:hypothetical protein
MLNFSQMGINPLVVQALGLDESTAPSPAPAPAPVRPGTPAPAAAGVSDIPVASVMIAGTAALLFATSIGASTYHGYKRNNSVGWAAMWGFSAFLFPILTPAVGIAQGFGKREKK